VDPERQVIGSIESLEAQLEIAREFVRAKKWENLDLVVQNIVRTVSCLADATLTARSGGRAASKAVVSGP
jgi:hypothetical protein